METIIRLFFFTLGLLAIGLLLWLSLTIIGVLLLVGGACMLFYVVRNFLLKKNILNPNPGVPMEPPAAEKITVIEASFTRVDGDSNV